MKKLFFAITLIALSPIAGRADTIGAVNFETLFINQFMPGTGSGISIASNGSNVGSPTGSGTTNVDLDGDGSDDIAVAMSYALFQTGDSRIGFRQNTAGTALTVFSDSEAATDFDYGFLRLSWNITSLTPGSVITALPDITTSSLNGMTELYEFGILDTAGTITAADIAAYNADDYTGGDGTFSGATNSLGDASEILLPEHLGLGLPGVTYDAEATITGDLGNNPEDTSDASDFISANGQNITLWYGGFDVGTDTTVGNPSASLNFDGDVQLTAIPEPGSLAAIFLGLTFGLTHRRRK